MTAPDRTTTATRPQHATGNRQTRHREPALIDRVLAGIDVHASKFVAAVLKPDHSLDILECGSARRRDLEAFVAELVVHEVECVAIEATGVYWLRLHTLLAEQGIEVILANPQQVRAVAGRKTDSRDARRLVYALANNSLEPSVIACAEQRELRALTRGRVGFVRSKTAHKNRIHKILRGAGIPLKDAVRDLFSNGMLALLQALAQGQEPDFEQPAIKKLRQKTRDKLREVLDGGFRLNASERLVLRLELQALAACEQAIKELDDAITAWLEQHPIWNAAVTIVDSIAGIGLTSAATIVAECGWDMSRFATEGHLASWAGVCPGQCESAGRKGSGKVPKGNPYVKRVLAECAQSLAASQKPGTPGYSLHQWVRRKAGRMHWNKAVFALAHRLLRLVWILLSRVEEYSEQIHAGMLAREEQRRIERAARYLRDQGYTVEQPTAPIPLLP